MRKSSHRMGTIRTSSFQRSVFSATGSITNGCSSAELVSLDTTSTCCTSVFSSSAIASSLAGVRSHRQERTALLHPDARVQIKGANISRTRDPICRISLPFAIYVICFGWDCGEVRMPPRAVQGLRPALFAVQSLTIGTRDVHILGLSQLPDRQRCADMRSKQARCWTILRAPCGRACPRLGDRSGASYWGTEHIR